MTKDWFSKPMDTLNVFINSFDWATPNFFTKRTNRDVVPQYFPQRSPDEIRHLIEVISERLEFPTNLSEQEKGAIGSLFFDELSKLPEEIFDRTLIKKDSNLEKMLVEELKTRMQHKESLIEVRKQYETVCLEPLAQSSNAKLNQAERTGKVLLDLVEKEALLALELGVKTKAAGSTSSGFFLCDLRGKKIAIFKPDAFGPRGKKNPKFVARVKRWFVKNIVHFNSIRQARQRVGEEFTYLASRSIGHMTVPPTKIAGIRSELLLPGDPSNEIIRGSLQILIDDVQSAGAYLQKKPPTIQDVFFKIASKIIQTLLFGEKSTKTDVSPVYKPTISEDKQLPQKLFFSFAVLDFITGQIDRHWENWMISIPKEQPVSDQAKEGQSREKIAVSIERLFSASQHGKYIVSIDNGASSPITYLSELESRNQYLWAELPMANSSVAELAKETPLEEGWQEKIVNDLLVSSLNEDLLDMPQEIQAERKTIEKLLHSFTREKRIPLPSLEKIRSELSGNLMIVTGASPLPPKLLRRLSKLSLQILAMQERIAVLEIFINPPKGQESVFTLKQLAQLRTKNDYQQFWHTFSKNPF